MWQPSATKIAAPMWHPSRQNHCIHRDLRHKLCATHHRHLDSCIITPHPLPHHHQSHSRPAFRWTLTLPVASLAHRQLATAPPWPDQGPRIIPTEARSHSRQILGILAAYGRSFSKKFETNQLKIFSLVDPKSRQPFWIT